jgi:small GTP-binding protein
MDPTTRYPRVVLVGDSSVGKTSLITSVTGETFNQHEPTTVGASWHMYTASIDGAQIELQLWDTAGQERYRTLGPLYYRSAVAAVAVFDVCNQSSFTNLPQWIDSVIAIAGPSTFIFIVGNKLDLAAAGAPRGADSDQALEWARARAYRYFETSAKTGEGVSMVFRSVAEEVAKLPRRGYQERTMIPQKRKCC